MVTALGTFELRRRHDPGSEPLRAWNAADEYALAHLAERGSSDDGVSIGRSVVVNDSFGALAVALAGAGASSIQSWSDSVVAHAALRDNLERNGLPADSVTAVPSTAVPEGPVDLALVKVPRSLALLDDQLRALRGVLGTASLVIGLGMTRSIHTSTIEAFERHLGPTPTTLARKKARLLLPTVDRTVTPPPSPGPVTWTVDGVVVSNLPNVFSRDGLDRGTSLLLANLPALAPGSTVVDLGCGNGVLAAALARRCPGLRVVCVDESYHALASARLTLSGVEADASFHAADVLDGIAGPVDLVVCNPPFHAGGARTTAAADRMFSESARVLRDDGELRIVANRHLPYRNTLRRCFGSVAVVASDPKFVVLSARRPRR